MQPDRTMQSRRAIVLAAAIAAGPAAAATSSRGFWSHVRRVFSFADAGRIEGSGKVIDVVRDVPAFTRLVLQGPIDVRLKAADTDRVVVHADDNIVSLIETVVQGDALVIGLRKDASYRTHASVRVHVQARQMNAVLLRGSGDIRADRIAAEVFEATIQGAGDLVVDALQANAVAVSIAGSGDFKAAGQATSLGIVIEGSGDAYCDKLQVRQAAIRIRGSGDSRVHATETLQVDIVGSGDVRYRGEPKVTRTVSGSGTVRPLR